MKPDFRKVTNKNNDNFVGIRGENNKIVVYYPESFELQDEIKDTFKILDCIKLTKIYNKNDQLGNSGLISEEDNNRVPIMSYFWIIKDYINNGFYTNKEIVKTNGIRGKIDWKKTLQQMPIVSNGKIFFSNFYSSFRTTKDNILVDIYKYGLKIALSRVGWLFKLDKLKINILEPSESQIKYYINVLKNELNKTFDDIKRERLQHLCLILSNISDEHDTRSFEYGTYSFHVVFETMIDKIFGGLENTKDYNPKGLWNLDAIIDEEFESSQLRPDTILKEEKTTYIIDSKYYRFGVTNDKSDLPETQSIQKQITYAEDLLKKTSNEKIYNVFIMPYNKSSNKFGVDKNLFRIGKSYTSWHDEGYNYEHIHTFLVDLRYVVDNYLNGSSEELVFDLKQQIHEVESLNENTSRKIDYAKKFTKFRRACEGRKVWDKALAANIDLGAFVYLYKKIGFVIDKFIQDNK